MSEPFVTLAGGLTVPLDAYNLAHELLTQRELLIVHVGDKLRIRNRDGSAPTFSEDERARIVRWKKYLIALITYQAPPIAQ